MSPLQLPILVLLKKFISNPFLAIISGAELFCLQAWSIAEQHKPQTVHSFLEGKNEQENHPKPPSKGCKEGSKHVLHKISTVASCQLLACWLDGPLRFLGSRFESSRICQRAHLARAPLNLHEGQGGLGNAKPVFCSIITQPHLPYSECAIRIQRSISPKNLLRFEAPITRRVGQRTYLENLSEIGGTHHKAGRSWGLS